MVKSVGVSAAVMSLLAAGAARAGVDMALEREEAVRAVFPTLGPKPDVEGDGKFRATLKMDTVFVRESEKGVVPPVIIDVDSFGVVDPTQAERRAVGFDPVLTEGYGVERKENPQASAYAAAADLLSPLPDRLSVNPDSPYFGEYGLVGVRFDGSDRPGDVEEYCVSEGWIRVRAFMANGKPKKERGRFVCLKRYGKVEPYRK